MSEITSVSTVPPSPFQRLARLIAGLDAGRPAIDLSVGEPRHPIPDFVGPLLQESLADFGRYPPIKGIPAFREAVAAWCEARFGLTRPLDREAGILPLNGSREGLFHAALTAVALAGASRTGERQRPAILLPNPFYAVYAAGAVAAGAEPVLLDATAERGFLPDPAALPASLLDRTAALYFCSPANPQGAVADAATWKALIELARRYGFWVFADECYSEIWRGEAPTGVLAASAELGGYDRVVAFNSLSKRSSLPGARCGFAVGDPAFIGPWAASRNVSAPQVPIPIQKLAVKALSDERHVAENRRLYDLKFAIAERHLGNRFVDLTPPGGFFLWLDVGRWGGSETVARRLWVEAGVKVVPGAYLAVGAAGANPGEDYIRVAMVESPEATEEAMSRMAEVLS